MHGLGLSERWGLGLWKKRTRARTRVRTRTGLGWSKIVWPKVEVQQVYKMGKSRTAHKTDPLHRLCGNSYTGDVVGWWKSRDVMWMTNQPMWLTNQPNWSLRNRTDLNIPIPGYTRVKIFRLDFLSFVILSFFPFFFSATFRFPFVLVKAEFCLDNVDCKHMQYD